MTRLAAPSSPSPTPVPTAAPPSAAATVFGGYLPEMALGAVVVFWSVSHILTKFVYRQIDPLALTFARFAAITALAFIVMAIRGTPGQRSIRRVDLPRFIGAGLAGYGVYQVCYALGLDRTSPFSSALLIAMVPLFSVIILRVMGEPTPLRAWVGLSIAVIGVGVFLSGSMATGGGDLLGDLLSLGAAVSFAVYGIINRPLAVRYQAATYTAYTLLAGTIPLFIVTGPSFFQQDWGSVSPSGWLILLYTIIFPVYIAYMLWNWGIAQRGIAAATSFQLVVPISSGVLAALFLGEQFGPIKLIGAAIVLAGLVVIRSRRRAAQHAAR